MNPLSTGDLITPREKHKANSLDDEGKVEKKSLVRGF